MAKRCWGITWGFNRCDNERLKIMVCRKHIWQFVQVVVLLAAVGAIVVTVELVKIYESRLAIMQSEKKALIENTEGVDDVGMGGETVNLRQVDDDYKSWDN